MALTNVQNEFLKMQLANNPEFKAEYFPNVITQPPTGPLYNVTPRRDRPANVFYQEDISPVDKIEPNLLGGGLGQIINRIPPSRPFPRGPLNRVDWDKFVESIKEPEKVAEFRDVNVPYDTPDSKINIKADPSSGIAMISPSEMYYKDRPLTGGQTSALYMHPEIMESYGTAPSSPRNEMVNTPGWYKAFEDYFGIEVGPTTDQAHLNDVIESILTHEVGHGVSAKEEYKAPSAGATTLDYSEFFPPNVKQEKNFKEKYEVSAYAQEELYNRMKDIEKLKMEYPDNYEEHPLWDLYQKRAQGMFQGLTKQQYWSKDRWNNFQKKIDPYVKSYFDKIKNKISGISGINIRKRTMGMPEHLTPPRKRTYTPPPRGGGADVIPIPPKKTVTPRHAPHPDRGGYEQSGGSAQDRGPPGGDPGWKGARGGYVDRPLPGRSRYL